VVHLQTGRSKSGTDSGEYLLLHYKLFAVMDERHNEEEETRTAVLPHYEVYPKDSGLAAWSESCKWYSSLPIGAVVSLFCE
jgi:hypothetical protein